MNNDIENRDLPKGELRLRADAQAMPIYHSDKLFGEASEIGIDHEGALYRLKITRQGKLVLNK